MSGIADSWWASAEEDKKNLEKAMQQAGTDYLPPITPALPPFMPNNPKRIHGGGMCMGVRWVFRCTTICPCVEVYDRGATGEGV